MKEAIATASATATATGSVAVVGSNHRQEGQQQWGTSKTEVEEKIELGEVGH